MRTVFLFEANPAVRCNLFAFRYASRRFPFVALRVIQKGFPLPSGLGT